MALTVAAGALAVAAFIASLVPATRAAALAPMVALRTD
jgi:ABC-type lipoprotein release transport system permease subunit